MPRPRMRKGSGVDHRVHGGQCLYNSTFHGNTHIKEEKK